MEIDSLVDIPGNIPAGTPVNMPASCQVNPLTGGPAVCFPPVKIPADIVVNIRTDMPVNWLANTPVNMLTGWLVNISTGVTTPLFAIRQYSSRYSTSTCRRDAHYPTPLQAGRMRQ